jgi:hypothetical protein
LIDSTAPRQGVISLPGRALPSEEVLIESQYWRLFHADNSKESTIVQLGCSPRHQEERKGENDVKTLLQEMYREMGRTPLDQSFALDAPSPETILREWRKLLE